MKKCQPFYITYGLFSLMLPTYLTKRGLATASYRQTQPSRLYLYWYFLAQMFLQLSLLPPLGHKEVIGTLGYPIASKLDDYLGFEHLSADRQTNTGLYGIDF